MARVQPILQCEINPLNPVPEALAVISALIPYHPNQEVEILQGIKEAIEKRQAQLKGVEKSDE